MKKESKEKIKEQIGEITWGILGAIARIPEALVGSFIDHRELNNNFSGGQEFLSDKLIDHLRNLKRRGYVEIKKENNGSYSVRLTTKGKIKNLENPNNKESDGKLRIISYDIPESESTKRQHFYRIIRRIGYRQLQKSLWICQYNKADEIDLVIDELGLRPFVAYFIVYKNNIEKHISQLLK